MKKILSALACVALAACDGGLEPQPMGISTLAFSYTAIAARPAGAYSAIGEVQLQGDRLPPGEWAFGMRGGFPPRMLVAASRPVDNGLYDRVYIHLPANVRAGQTLRFRQMCEDSPSCTQTTIEFGVQPQDPIALETGCVMTAGELRLIVRTHRRASGTFTGRAECFGAATGEAQVTHGVFDVVLVTPPA
jgi:hypothetical protein